MSKSAPYTWRSQKGYISPAKDETKRENQKKAVTRFTSIPFADPPPNHSSRPVLAPYPPCICHIPCPPWMGMPAPFPPLPSIPRHAVRPQSSAHSPVHDSESCCTATNTASSESDDENDDNKKSSRGEKSAETPSRTICVRIKETFPSWNERSKQESTKEPTKKDKGSLKQPSSAPTVSSSGTTTHQAIRVLSTGKPVHIHIINAATTKLTDIIKKSSERASRFRFRIFQAQDNSSLTQVMDELDAGEGSTAGQLFECGSGVWRKGKLMEYGDENAGRTLAELGWSGAGGKDREPVWLFLMRKKEGRK